MWILLLFGLDDLNVTDLNPGTAIFLKVEVGGKIYMICV